jgi:hypothetical protein
MNHPEISNLNAKLYFETLVKTAEAHREFTKYSQPKETWIDYVKRNLLPKKVRSKITPVESQL